jgi:hypothetical protein
LIDPNIQRIHFEYHSKCVNISQLALEATPSVAPPATASQASPNTTSGGGQDEASQVPGPSSLTPLYSVAQNEAEPPSTVPALPSGTFDERETSQNFLVELVPHEDPEIEYVTQSGSLHPVSFNLLPSYSIVVHGLNPTNTKFHAYETWTSTGGNLWLKDFLPTSLPTVRARVLLFGYNANVAFKTSTAGVREQANNLLNRLYLIREGNDASQRPIVFICHSLGGIVVKQVSPSSMLEPYMCSRTHC